MPFLMDTCGDCLYCRPAASRSAYAGVHQLLDVGRLRRAARLLDAAPDARPRRDLATRRPRRCRSRSAPRGTCSSRAAGLRAGRDGDDQLGRQRHRLGRRPARATGGRDRDRQRELRREAGARERARHGSRDQPRDPGRRRRGDAAHRRPRRRPRLRARRRRALPEGARLARQGRAPRHLRRPLRRGGAVRHHPVLPRQRQHHRLVRLHPQRGRDLPRARAPGKITPLVHETFPLARRARRWRRWSGASTSARSSSLSRERGPR